MLLSVGDSDVDTSIYHRIGIVGLNIKNHDISCIESMPSSGKNRKLFSWLTLDRFVLVCLTALITHSCRLPLSPFRLLLTLPLLLSFTTDLQLSRNTRRFFNKETKSTRQTDFCYNRTRDSYVGTQNYIHKAMNMGHEFHIFSSKYLSSWYFNILSKDLEKCNKLGHVIMSP